MAVHSSFPNVELEWLLSGKGSAVEGLPDKTPAPAPDQDYPLLPGMESAFFPADGRKTPEILNPGGEEKAPKPRKSRGNKDVRSDILTAENGGNKAIKEVVVFFADGTYQKFSPDLKK